MVLETFEFVGPWVVASNIASQDRMIRPAEIIDDNESIVMFRIHQRAVLARRQIENQERSRSRRDPDG